MAKQEKWIRFRQKRDQQIDKYIKAKRLCQITSAIIVLTKVVDFFKVLLYVFQMKKHKRQVYLYSGFLCYKMKLKWKRQFKKYGKTLDILHQKKIQQGFKFAYISTYRLQYIRAKKMILKFMKKNKTRVEVYGKFIKALNHILDVQNNFKNRWSIHSAKVDTLIYQWNKLVQ